MKTEREIRLELIELYDCLEWGTAIIDEADKETQAKIEALEWVLGRKDDDE